MTPTEQRDIIQAYIDGKTIEQESATRGWIEVSKDVDIEFNFYGHDYRIKPESKKTYWSKPENVPVGAIIKWISSGEDTIILSVTRNLIEVWRGHIDYGNSLKEYHWRFSHELKDTDWKECTVESLEKYR